MRFTTFGLICLALSGIGPSARTPQATAPPSSSAAGTARIRGQVVAADSNAPVRGATVNLSSPGTGGWTVTTDPEGRFEIADLPVGKFALSVEKAGWVTTPFGWTPASPRGTNIDLTDGQRFDRADVRLPRGMVIAGRVIDDNGEPVIEAYVTALQFEYITGGRRLHSVRDTQTNDLGEFRLYGLMPGTYYVAAGLRTMQFASANGSGAPAPRFVATGESVAPTFYPGTARSAEARPIVVDAESTTPAITIALQSVPLSRISGTITTSSGRPGSDMLVMVNPASADGLPMAFNETEPDAAGHFTLPNITPGAYRVDVVSKASMEAIAKTGGAGRSQTIVGDECASVPVSINGEDIESLAITTSAGFHFKGRVIADGARPAAGTLKVSLIAASAGLSISSVLLGASGAVADDGSFDVRGLVGSRLVRVNGLPDGWALESVRAGGADVTDTGLEFNRDVGDAEIILTARPAQMSGVVTDDRGTPLKDDAVAVFAADRRLWTLPMSRYVRSARTAADGTFTIGALPAGAYLAIAAESLAPGERAH